MSEFLDFDPFMINAEQWYINKNRTVLIFMGGMTIYRAHGQWNMARKVENPDWYCLRNIYVMPEARGKGLCKQYMFELYWYFSMRNKALFLFPTPFEFSANPIEDPINAIVQSNYQQDRTRLYDMYEGIGFMSINSAFFNMTTPHRMKTVNTTISGEDKPRKTMKDELFAPITIDQNMGYRWLGAGNVGVIPEDLFVETERLYCI